jgi:uncharacterized protein YdiU (UPF0061 family)
VWNFDNTYLALPDAFYSKVAPVPVREPKIVLWNEKLADELGLPKLSDPNIFSGNKIPSGAEPIAQAYAGHQYAHFTMLGDGRAVLLGEHIAPNGQRFDIQLKGSGQTPYSRRGDGRAALGPMLREYIVSEAMHALGIPTTRSLAVTATGEPVYREEVLPGAILTRVAASHIRVGTFEYAAARSLVKPLADYTIKRHYPELRGKPYRDFLGAVIIRQAKLVAKWMSVGFIHGVMNTDNMAISGETIDYGPCAFMDQYNPATVFSSIDSRGRYAYRNQGAVAQWNLARFAETLLPLLHDEEEKALAIATEEIETFPDLFRSFELSEMRKKLGLISESTDDGVLVSDFLTILEKKEMDFTNSFRDITVVDADWTQRWQNRVERDGTVEAALERMKKNNPAVIPRNHRVEEALAAAQHGDIAPTERLIAAVSAPFAENVSYQTPPAPHERVKETFCGT